MTRIGLFLFMKDTFYFTHDYNARNDIKIKKLIQKFGMSGYGIFWSIVEDLYNNANALPTDYESIAYDLRTDADTIKSIINDFDLFIIDGKEFGSRSIENRLNERNEKSKKARKAALTRWNKSDSNANALPTESEGNTIKESKGKEKKEIKEKKEDEIKAILPKAKSFKQFTEDDFKEDLKQYLNTYKKEMLIEFYNYWSEKSATGLMRFQLGKTWETERRLMTWYSNQKAKVAPSGQKPTENDVMDAAQRAIYNIYNS